jgi:hypothetical protein
VRAVSGVFGDPTGAAWLALVGTGLTMEALEKVRELVHELGPNAHKVFSEVLKHLPPPTEMGSGDPDVSWQGP